MCVEREVEVVVVVIFVVDMLFGWCCSVVLHFFLSSSRRRRGGKGRGSGCQWDVCPLSAPHAAVMGSLLIHHGHRDPPVVPVPGVDPLPPPVEDRMMTFSSS